MHGNRSGSRASLITLAFAAATPSAALAQVATWTGPFSGVWNAPERWSWSPTQVGFPNSSNVDVVIQTPADINVYNQFFTVRNMTMNGLTNSRIDTSVIGGFGGGVNVVGNVLLNGVVQADTIRQNGGATGTFIKTGPGQAELRNSIINLQTPLQVREGSLRVQGTLPNVPSFDIAAGSAIALLGPNSFNSPVFTGNGRVYIGQGGISLSDPAFEFSGTLSGADIVLGVGPTSTPNMQINARGNFTFGAGTFSLNGGIYSQGTAVVSPNARLNFYGMQIGDYGAAVNAQLINNGVLEFSGKAFADGAADPFGMTDVGDTGAKIAGGVITNNNLALLMAGDIIGANSSTGRFQNTLTGVIRKTTPATSRLGSLNNAGLVEVKEGLLDVYGASATSSNISTTGVSTGRFAVAAGANLALGSHQLNNAEFTGPGRTTLYLLTSPLDPQYLLNATLTGTLRAANLQLGDPTRPSPASLLGTATFSGSTVTWASDRIGGDYTIDPTTIFNIAPAPESPTTAVVRLNGRLQNDGSLNVGGGTITWLGSGSLLNNALLSATTTATTPINLSNVAITNSATGSFIKTGPGTLTLAANTFINRGSVSVQQGALSLAAGSNFSTISLASATALSLNGYRLENNSSILGPGTLQLTSGTNTLSGNVAVTAPISSTGGTLFLENSALTGSPSFTASAGTVVGTGSLLTPVTLLGGRLSPGTTAAPIGRIAITGNLTLSSAATVALDINASASADTVQILAGNAVLSNAALALTLNPLIRRNISLGDTFTLLDLDDNATLTGTFLSRPEASRFTVQNLVEFQITYAGGASHNDVVLTVTSVIPEPAALALLAALPLAASRPRRQKTSSRTT